MVVSTAQRCQAVTKTGKPCRGHAISGSGFCFTHDPARAAERAKARSRGGRARHGRKNIEPTTDEQIDQLTPQNILKVLTIAVNDCLKLERSLARSRTLASVAATALKAIEATELEARIAALEAIQIDRSKQP